MNLRKNAGTVVLGGVEVPVGARVQGIGTTIDDLTLEGSSWRAMLGDAAIKARLQRTTEGASTVTVDVHDPDGSLRRNPLMRESYTVDLDGLEFRKVKVSQRDSKTLQITHEDEEVFRLRQQRGALKAARGVTTRGAFGRQLVRGAGKPLIPFYCPQLYTRPKITNAKDARTQQATRAATRQPGLAPNANFTVKGVRADAGQIANCNRVLDVGMGLKVAEKVLVCAIVVGITENLCRHGTGGDRDSNGWFQQRPSQSWGPAADLEVDANDFYKGRSTNIGAIAAHRQNPSASAAAIAQTVQRSAPNAYGQYLGEAQRIVELYLNGTSATTSTATDTKETKPDALERGKKENSWDALGRLAEEVTWRRFVSAGIVYYLAETDLLGSAVRLVIGDSTPGVLDLTFDADSGKTVSEVTLKANVKAWAAPPGTVVDLNATLGPAAGRYIVGDIEQDLGSQQAEADITLRRPVPETKAKTNKTNKGGKGTTKKRKIAKGGGANEAQTKWLDWLRSTVGVSEGSNLHRRWAGSMGLSTSLPWCAIYVSYGLKNVLGVPYPSSPAYSGAFLSWSGGRRVSKGQMEPGDIVIFDWGDGGITDHVAVYVGNGQRIGGNESNRVSLSPLMPSAIVGVVRPNVLD